MNNRERVFCAVVKTLYEKYLETKALDFNALVFTQRELESSFNSLHFGKAFKKSLLNNYYYGHGSKKEKVKFIVNAFEEESLGYLRLAYPNEIETYSEQFEITKQGWSVLSDFNQDEVCAFLKKYNSWIKKHIPEKNQVENLSANEAAWVSAALLTYNAYAHNPDADVSDFYFANANITNLAYEIAGEYAKSTYANAVKMRAVKGVGKDEFLSECQKGKRRVTFKHEVGKSAPKLDSSVKLYTVNGKKGINAIAKALQEIALYYLPTNEEYDVLLDIGKSDKAHVCVDDILVKRNKDAVIEYIVSKYCENPITELEFKNKYNALLSEADLAYDVDYVINNFDTEILDRKDVIDCGHNRFRYYSNKGRNAGNTIPSLELKKYENQEFSAALIQKNNLGVMLDARLKNEYEVYDYLRKFAGKYCANMEFLDDLEIRIGNASMTEQLLRIIEKYEPIGRNYLINIYMQKYGSSKDLIQSKLRELNEYYSDGYYRAEQHAVKTATRTQEYGAVKSTLAQIQDGDKSIQRQNPDIRLIANISNKYISEDSDWGKLHNRIIREFIDSDLIGEIELSDDEYILLMKRYFVPSCNRIINTRNPMIVPDIIFTVGLVQVAIRNYDSNFWGRVADEIGIDHFTTQQQSKIGGIVSQTLIKYGKAYVEAGEHVRNVLMHAFIVDNYAFDFFEYLFQFYNLDLERSISDTCDEEARYICDAIKNPNSKRQQMLSDYSGLSVYASGDYCKNVIAASLVAIDNAFWNSSKNVEGLPSRLYDKFILWKNNEKGDFRKAKNRKERDSESYRKFFNSPQLVCDFSNDVQFEIVLPKQLLQNTDKEYRNIYWRVSNALSVNEYVCTVKEGSFGLKTEEYSFFVDEKDIFLAYTFELLDDGEVIRKFTWNRHEICLFDESGNHVNIENLSEGEYIGFSLSSVNVESEAIEDSYNIRGLTYYQLVFRFGDILYVPGEANYYVGDVPQRGFSNDGLLADVFVEVGESRLPVYSKIPALVINIEDERLGGTAIIVNNSKIKASDLKAVDIKNANVMGQKYYYFDLSGISGISNGINSVDVDVPGSSRGKRLDFILLKDFSFSFEDAPYINKTRGTLCSNYRIDRTKTIINEHVSENEYMDFEFDDLIEDILECPIMFGGQKYIIGFKVPLLLYSTDRTEWTFYKPEDYWYANLPRVIYLSYPAKAIKLELVEDNGEKNAFTYEKRLDGIIECDLTKLKSYVGPFHTKKMIHTIQLIDGNNEYEFLRVVNHSVFANVELSADIENNEITGNFDILGKGNYYVDILFKGDLICEKQPLNHERQLTVKAEIKTGYYDVSLFEGEEDEDSFDDIRYQIVGSLKKKLRNPADIAGEHVKLKRLTYVNEGTIVHNLPISDKRQNYIRIDKKIDQHTYEGTLIVAFHDTDIRDVKKVRVTIPKLSKANSMLVDFYDEYDDIDNLLYDSYSECVATPEYSDQYGKNEKYRRFNPILWTDDEESYFWDVEFINVNKEMEQAAKEWTKQEHFNKTNSNSIWKS